MAAARGEVPGGLGRDAARPASDQPQVQLKLGGSTPAASSPHRGARFASMRLLGIGQQTLPGSIRPSGAVSQEAGENNADTRTTAGTVSCPLPSPACRLASRSRQRRPNLLARASFASYATSHAS